MVFDKVKKIIVDQLDVEEDKVTEAASITDDLGADSLDVVDLVIGKRVSTNHSFSYIFLRSPLLIPH